MRRDGFFCSVTAAALLRVPLPARLQNDPLLHVAVPRPTRAPEGKGVHGHSVSVSPGDVRVWNGLRISAPERLWCELSTKLTVPQLVAVGDFLIQRHGPLTSVDRLTAASAGFVGTAGRSRRSECLPYLDPGSESPTESELRVILMVAKISGFVANMRIDVPGARYRGDLVFPRERVVIEYQGEYHFDPAQWRKDMTRIERLRAAGWFVMQVNYDDLGDPVELVARIRSVLASRSAI